MTLPTIRYRVMLVCTGVVVIPVLITIYALLSIFGYPRPLAWSILGYNIDHATHLLDSEQELDAEVVGVTYAQNEAIYLWVIPRGSRVPVSLILPWDQKQAETLQKLRRQQQQNRGRQGDFSLRFQRSFSNDEMKFYDMPAPMPPPKEGQEEPLPQGDVAI